MLRNAILDGDSEKAIAIYTTENNGKILIKDFLPSQTFPGKSYSDQTPLHLAALCALEAVISICLDHGGNPDQSNGFGQTSLQCVCLRGDNQDIRFKIIESFLMWRGTDKDGVCKVSINHVDSDGNAALHLAAKSGLIECVIKLVREGAIISLVNKDQMTCCEVADAAYHNSLADMLEAALVFQPIDTNLDVYDLEPEHSVNQSTLIRNIVLDSQSMTSTELNDWAIRAVNLFTEVTNLPGGRIMALLGGYDWDVTKALQDYVMDPATALKNAQLDFETTPFVTPNNTPMKNDISSEKTDTLNNNSLLSVESTEKCYEDQDSLDIGEILFDIDGVDKAPEVIEFFLPFDF